MNLKLYTSKDKVGLLLVLVSSPFLWQTPGFVKLTYCCLFKHDLNIESYWKIRSKNHFLKCYLEYDFETYFEVKIHFLANFGF